MTQISGGVGEPGPDIPALAECQVPFEERDGLGEHPLTEIHPTDPAIRVDQAEGVIDRLSQMEPCFCTGNRLMVVPTGIVDGAQVEIRDDLRTNIADGLREGDGVLAGRNGAVRVTYLSEILGHIGGDPAQPTVIVYGLGERFGLA